MFVFADLSVLGNYVCLPVSLYIVPFKLSIAPGSLPVVMPMSVIMPMSLSSLAQTALPA